MHYLGGKARIAKPLSEYLNSRLVGDQPYWEPFCGACWVIQNIDVNRKRYASDIHEYLIALWKGLQSGWIPPDYISNEEYNYLKNCVTDKVLHGFAGFACSFGGKWWGGYARDPKSDRNYTKNAKNSLLKKIEFLRDVNFFCCEFKKPKPAGFLIDCDPPYAGTTEYNNKFDSHDFWEWVKKMSTNNTVLVSEYKAPPDFEIVWSHKTRTDLGNKDNQKIERTEKLFEYKGEK